MNGRLRRGSELPPTWRSVLLLGAWGLCGVLAVRFCLLAIDAAPRQSHGFVNLYTAARLYRPWTLLAYPKLYGAWLLWALSLVMLYRSGPVKLAAPDRSNALRCTAD